MNHVNITGKAMQRHAQNKSNTVCRSRGRKSKKALCKKRRTGIYPATVELLSKALSYFGYVKNYTGNFPAVNSTWLKIRHAYPIPDTDYSENSHMLLESFYYARDNFPMIGVTENYNNSPIETAITKYLQTIFGKENFAVHTSGGSILFDMHFLHQDMDCFHIIETSIADKAVKGNSIMALAFLKVLEMMQSYAFAKVNFGLGQTGDEDYTQVQDEIYNYVSEDDDIAELGEDFQEGAIEEKMGKIINEIDDDYYGYPYHYGKIIDELGYYDFDIPSFLEIFKDEDFEYKEVFSLVDKLSKCPSVMDIANEFFLEHKSVRSVDVNMQDYFIICYEEQWSEYAQSAPLSYDTYAMQGQFEEGTLTGLTVRIEVKQGMTFPEELIKQFITIINETEYIKTLLFLHRALKFAHKESTMPFSNKFIDNYCKKNNCTIFSWLEPKAICRRSRDLSEWNSFRDFDTQCNNFKTPWPYAKRNKRGKPAVEESQRGNTSEGNAVVDQ